MESVQRAREVAQKYCAEATLHHTKIVVALCKELLKHYQEADGEVVEIAAWLHDIGRYDDNTSTHATRSVELADETIAHHPKRELIRQCILMHGSKHIDEKNPIEIKMLQSSDGLSFFYDTTKINKIKESQDAELINAKLKKKLKKTSVLQEGRKLAEKKLNDLGISL